MLNKLDKKFLDEAKARGKLIFHSEEIPYARFREDIRNVVRGTVVLGDGSDRVIFGFPHIARVFTLEKGIVRNLQSDSFYAEEKIDGFNLRVAKIGKKTFAFSRGGFVDPFSTEKVRSDSVVPDSFFRDYPDYVLCGEMIGNTPYTPPTKDFDVRFLVFDIADDSGNYLAPPEKYAVLKKYHLESVPQLGKFTKNPESIKRLKDVVLTLNKSHKEGMVLKADDRKSIIKFVTPNADIDDIAHNAHLLFDMPTGFFLQRLLRSSIFVSEFGLDQKKYASELGDAFSVRLLSALKDAEAGSGAFEEFEVLLSDKKTWDGVMKHMSKEVRIEILSNREEKSGSTRIRFKKIYKKTSKKLHGALSGKGQED